MKVVVSLKGGLQVAAVSPNDSAFSFQVVGNYDYTELLDVIDDLCRLARQRESYYSKSDDVVGNIHFYKMEGSNISAIVNNCRVLYHGHAGVWEAISKAIKREVIKQSKKEQTQ